MSIDSIHDTKSESKIYIIEGDTSESNGNDNNGNEDSIIIVNAEDVEKADN